MMQDNILVRTIVVSAFLHALVLVMVMTVDLPPPPSQADYSEWVKRIATPPREAVLAPVEEGYKPLPEAKNTPENKAEETAGGGGGGGAKGAPAAKGGGGGGAKQAAVRASVSGKGVLGVIGVASGGGGGGEFEDVFSSSSGGVSGDLEGAMAGKRSVALPGAGSGLGRKRIGGEGEGSGEGSGGGTGSGTADIGGVGVGAGGSVESNKRRQAELTAPQVSGGESDLLSGNIDRKGVSAIIARKKSGFQRCYERGLKMDTHLRGKLVFELTIGDDGNVLEVRFLEDTLKSKEVADCVKGILTRLTLPKPQGALATIKNTLAFEPPQ